MTDESPDTEEQLTSQDFIKEGPIERGTTVHPVFDEDGKYCGKDFAILSVPDPRAALFKAMAFEADKEAKRLQARVTELESRLATASSTLVSVSGQEAKYRAALLDIEGRVASWRDSHWVDEFGGSPAAPCMLAILAVVKRVK